MNEQIPMVKKSFYSVVIKRILDIVISGIVIICFSWLYLIITIMELLIHGKPVIYKQERPGKDEKLFCIYKFRSMTNETDENGNLLPGERRITGFGRFLRRFSLDELPELVNVFTGKMSLIGPRPLLPMSLPYFSERHHMRHSVRPGLACIPLKPTKTWSWNDQFENDIYYIEHISFLLDVKMILAVAREAIMGSEYRVNDTREEYNGTNLYEDAYRTEGL